MAKAPKPDRVKTRLVPPLGPDEAAELSRCFIADMAGKIAGVARTHPIAGVVAFTPAEEGAAFDGLLPNGFSLLPQRGGDLGERLVHVVEDLLAAGFGAVALINADSPTLPEARLAEAARYLDAPGDRVVLGEADDGGYYLIGIKRSHRHLFHRIDWSTPRVFRQSLDRACEIGLPVARLRRWYDVDDVASLVRLYAELATAPAGQRDVTESAAPATGRYLRALVASNSTLQKLLAAAGARDIG